MVGSDNKIDGRPVKVAERVDSLWVIEEGLKPGDRVVADGAQKVTQGTLVNPTPYGAPPSPRAGVPAESTIAR